MGTGLGGIRSDVNQTVDLCSSGQARTAARSFRTFTGKVVTEARGVLLSNQLEVRQRNLRVGELITLKPHFPRRQPAVTYAGIKVDGSYS